MVELVPTPFAEHLVRIHRELARQDAVFDLPRPKWFHPDPAGPDLSVRFHGMNAANPAGPAAGPHGQMAQNILLSYLAGGRIIELKTVQVNDRLQIPRPCIDATNVGYNVEWSQELPLGQSLHEYVSGAMLVHVVRQGGFFHDLDLAGPLGDVIYDMSVGYDLAGIQSPTVRRFIEGMLDATEFVDRLRLQIPAEFRRLRDLDYPTRLSRSITLSTFHGCPADEIERICTHLLNEYGVGVIVKMNPPMLGKERLEHLLHDVMGYDDIRVHQPAYASGLQFDDAVAMIRRLDALAQTKGLRCGAKFSNTLEVENHRDFFTENNRVMYMSGAPLFVITMALTAAFREAIGADVPISYSAGVDQKNFADVVACGIAPVTTCTDLLRPGGYARLPKYLHHLAEAMTRAGARTIDEYIHNQSRDREGAGDPSRDREGAGDPSRDRKGAGDPSRDREGAGDPSRDRLPLTSRSDVQGKEAESQTPDDSLAAGLHNTLRLAERAANDPRYTRARNSAVPRRIDSRLVIFDCLTCDKCIPVCPNDANFTYPLAAQRFDYRDLSIDAGGAVAPVGETKSFATERGAQIANFADYCNECGNCDTFCPEYGGPFIEKPTFFSTLEQFERHRTHDGFCVRREAGADIIHGRIKGAGCMLRADRATGAFVFHDEHATVCFDAAFNPTAAALHPTGDPPHPTGESVHPPGAAPASPSPAPHTVDLHIFHTLRLLLQGVLDPTRINPVNAALVTTM